MTKYRIRYMPITSKYDIQFYQDGWLTNEQFDLRFDSWQDALDYIESLSAKMLAANEPVIVWEGER